MGYWIYIQAFLDLALVLALGALLVDRRRRLPVAAWRREVTALVDTLGELVVEVDRVTTRATASGTSPAEAVPAEVESALAAAVFAGDGPGPEAARETAQETFQVASGDGADVAPAFLPAYPEIGPATPAGDRLADAVLAFTRDGLAPEEIARRVGRPVGEVALVLGLSRAQAAPVGA